MIEIKQLTKRFKTVTALDDISLKIEAGEFFGLLGPNGAGKSTLMNLLSGYIFPDSGSLMLDGQELHPHDQEARRVLGLVPQSLALYDEMSALKNMEIFGSLYGEPKKALKERIEYWLNKVQLWDRRKDKVKGFSGGMKRRLNIVTSLLHDPKVLLCDEPTVGVDPQSRNAIFEFLEEQNQKGLTIIYTTHYMEEVERMCKRIAIIDGGKILTVGSKNELVAALPVSQEITYDPAVVPDPLRASLALFGEVTEEGSRGVVETRDNLKLSEFYSVVEKAGVPYSVFKIRQPSIETLFLHLTGKKLRE